MSDVVGNPLFLRHGSYALILSCKKLWAGLYLLVLKLTIHYDNMNDTIIFFKSYLTYTVNSSAII